jgi:hypothetical protein
MIIDITQVKAIDIIVISEGLEANALRAALEAFGIQVRMHYIGNVKHLISLLQNPDYLHRIIIISCHGDEESLLIPELSPELEVEMPYQRKLTPHDLSNILNLNNQVVINTGCCLGTKEFADSFLSKGASAYIGSEDYIEGGAIILFVITFLYFYVSKSLPIDKSFNQAQYIDDEMKFLKLWKKND